MPTITDKNNITTAGETIIKELNNEIITLFPFTFDDFGSMGQPEEIYFLENN